MQQAMRKRIEMRIGARLFAVLTCVALALWTVSPNASHVPKVIETLQDHAEMIAEHGHSHGLEEDLIWAMHGHSHEVADHDHSQAVLMLARRGTVPVETSALWHGYVLAHWAPPVFRLERPPRA
ncbi:hypothetical protein SAMN04490248_13312 [Salinihabitans flavidus]|uniref:Uncharacterized protein n=1 Tax=Salinihabitans flavidus TaxID=569882 RepID=A0A1H8VRQ4_9RHOB|nr:hypothetical protein [Salinihabitans flavidus]SEP18071.1 hypothetical protein SAMN04490248_13312 [Salinihabitans flavidus]